MKRTLFFALTLFPMLIFANAGSPMMWFGMFHCLIVNAIIGITESLIVREFKIPNRMWIIILGNYVSMIIGLNYIAPHFSSISGNLDFWGGKTDFGDYNLKGFFVGMFASYIATLFIELPFFYFAVKSKINKKALLSFFSANTVTNFIMLIVYYWIVKDGGKW